MRFIATVYIDTIAKKRTGVVSNERVLVVKEAELVDEQDFDSRLARMTMRAIASDDRVVFGTVEGEAEPGIPVKKTITSKGQLTGEATTEG